MLVVYRLFRRWVTITTPTNGDCPSNSTPSESSVASTSPEKDRAILIWWAVFGISLFFRPAAELVFRFLSFSVCALLIGALNGTLDLLIGHAVLRAAKYDGYDSSLLLSMAAGSLGGIIVMGPTALAIVLLITLVGPKFQRVLSHHVVFLLELTSLVAVAAAACSLGVTVVQCMYPDNDPPLNATHAARAGALGACILTVPLVSTAAFFMCAAQTTPAASEPRITAPHLVRHVRALMRRINDMW